MEYKYDNCAEHRWPEYGKGVLTHTSCRQCAGLLSPEEAACGMPDCTNPECFANDTEKEIPVTNTITHTIEQTPAVYFVDGDQYDTLQEATDRLAFLVKNAPNVTHYMDYNTPGAETLTLHPIRQAGYTLAESVKVYLRVEPLRSKNKIKLIKILREMNGLGLRDVVESVNNNSILSLGKMPVGVAIALDTLLRENTHGAATYDTQPAIYAEHI